MHGGAKTKILEWGINLVCTVLEVEDKHQFTVYSCVCMCDNERERGLMEERKGIVSVRYMYLQAIALSKYSTIMYSQQTPDIIYEDAYVVITKCKHESMSGSKSKVPGGPRQPPYYYRLHSKST